MLFLDLLRVFPRVLDLLPDICEPEVFRPWLLFMLLLLLDLLLEPLLLCVLLE
jgi:hypothetical protein